MQLVRISTEWCGTKLQSLRIESPGRVQVGWSVRTAVQLRYTANVIAGSLDQNTSKLYYIDIDSNAMHCKLLYTT